MWVRKGAYLGWFEGIVCWKMNSQEENASLIWTVSLKDKKKNMYKNIQIILTTI